jgi:glutaminase A
VASAALKQALHDAYAHARKLGGGRVADYIPELGKADPKTLALAACSHGGEVITLGDAAVEFTIQSISKPFVYGLALADHGLEAVHKRVGVEPTGDAFNSIIRLEQSTNRPHNPMINAGAIAVTNMIEAKAGKPPLERLLELFALAAGRESTHVDLPVYLSEAASGHRNRAIAHLMKHFGMLHGDIERTLELYFQQCSVLVNCRDLAVMAATLANKGVNPVSGMRVLPEEAVTHVLNLMLTCGLYDSAGRFAFEAGIPAKSGVCGGVIAVAQGKAGLAVFSPPLDERSNSLRGLHALREISETLKLHAFDAPVRKVSQSTRLGAVTGRRAAVRESVSSGRLQKLLEETHRKRRNEHGGAVADYIAELARANPKLFGLSICTVEGEELGVGDTDVPFTLQAAANPFTYSLALQARGVAALHSKVGFEPSGNPFNAIVLDPHTNRPFNPLSNAGAIAACSMIPGEGATARLNHVLAGLGCFAAESSLRVDLQVLLAERATGERNKAIACLLRNFNVIENEEAALELYFQQCSIAMTCRQLARMGATLAAGGVNPVSRAVALDNAHVKHVLALMYTCGLHDGSGQFAFDVGIPSKSGISGGLIGVVPGRFALAAFSPPVDAKGTSVRGALAMRDLSGALGVGLFA